MSLKCKQLSITVNQREREGERVEGHKLKGWGRLG